VSAFFAPRLSHSDRFSFPLVSAAPFFFLDQTEPVSISIPSSPLSRSPPLPPCSVRDGIQPPMPYFGTEFIHAVQITSRLMMPASTEARLKRRHLIPVCFFPPPLPPHSPPVDPSFLTTLCCYTPLSNSQGLIGGKKPRVYAASLSANTFFKNDKRRTTKADSGTQRNEGFSFAVVSPFSPASLLYSLSMEFGLWGPNAPHSLE